MQCTHPIQVYVPDDGGAVRNLRSCRAATCESGHHDDRSGNHRSLHCPDRTRNDESRHPRDRRAVQSKCALDAVGEATAMEPEGADALRSGHQPGLCAKHAWIGAEQRTAVPRIRGSDFVDDDQQPARQLRHCCGDYDDAEGAHHRNPGRDQIRHRRGRLGRRVAATPHGRQLPGAAERLEDHGRAGLGGIDLRRLSGICG